MPLPCQNPTYPLKFTTSLCVCCRFLVNSCHADSFSCHHVVGIKPPAAEVEYHLAIEARLREIEDVLPNCLG